eukprot:2056031-Amphidinium_carterae.1
MREAFQYFFLSGKAHGFGSLVGYCVAMPCQVACQTGSQQPLLEVCALSHHHQVVNGVLWEHNLYCDQLLKYSVSLFCAVACIECYHLDAVRLARSSAVLELRGDGSFVSWISGWRRGRLFAGLLEPLNLQRA